MTWRRFAFTLLQWVVAFAVVRWLVGGSFWLDFFLAGAVSGSSYGGSTFAEHRRLIAEQRRLLEIADAQLVKVSATVERLEEEVADLTARVNGVEAD